MSEFLTSYDVTSMLRVTNETLRHWIRAGKFPRPDARRGRRNIWKRETVEAALEKMPRRPVAM